jgi:hypothetical protein
MAVTINGNGVVTGLDSEGSSDLGTELEAAGGLVMVTPTTIANSGGTATLTAGAVAFSGVTSVSLNGVFSSAYSNYRVLIEGISSVSVDTFFRYRASGSDNSVATYNTQYVDFAGTVEDANRANNQTSNLVGVCGSASDGNFMTVDVARPNLAQRTISLSYSFSVSAGGYVRQSSTFFDNTTVFDGFTFFANTGNITGSIRVYGYRNGI